MSEPLPTDPKAVLTYLEQRARRRFGQHFLTRPEIVAKIVRGAGVKPGDRVVEIGPGLGILTDALLAAGAELTAVELDRDLAAWIRLSRPSVRLIEADATRVNWAETCPGSGWKVVANLPYNVGTGLVADLIRDPRWESLTVMLQREVVDRMVAIAGSDAYGALSVHIAAYARADALFRVPAGAFHPPPKVESAILRLDRWDEPRCGPAGPEGFGRVVKAAFAQRRKTVLNSLSSMFPRDRVEAALTSAAIDPRARAETLDLAAFQRLAAALTPSTP